MDPFEREDAKTSQFSRSFSGFVERTQENAHLLSSRENVSVARSSSQMVGRKISSLDESCKKGPSSCLLRERVVAFLDPVSRSREQRMDGVLRVSDAVPS